MAKEKEETFEPDMIRGITLSERDLLYALIFHYVDALSAIEKALEDGKRKQAREIVLKVKALSGPFHAILHAMNQEAASRSPWPDEISVEPPRER